MPRELRRQHQVRRVKSIRPPRQPIEREEYELEPLKVEKRFLPSFQEQYEAELEARAMPPDKMPQAATILERVVYKALWDRGYRPPDLDFQSSMAGGRLEWGFGRQVADFAIHSLGIIIECQGAYWHQFGEQHQRDLEREVRLRLVPRPVPWLVYFLEEPVIRDRYRLELWLNEHVVHAGLRHEQPAAPMVEPQAAPETEGAVVVGSLPDVGDDWTGRSPINHLVNGGFSAGTAGWTSTGDVTVSIVSGKLRLNASVADKGVYQAANGLEPNALYTVACKVSTGGNSARIYTTGGHHNADDTVMTAATATWVGQSLTSSSGVLTIHLTAHTTGVDIDFDDVRVFRGNLAFPFVDNALDTWRHSSDVTKIDGADIYPGSVGTSAMPDQSANTVLGGPASGSAAPPSFRALVDTDIPAAIARDTEVSSAVSTHAALSDVHHARKHAITSSDDHTSTATSGQMLKADANGLPVNATNTDTEVSTAVTKAHDRKHAITSSDDHTVDGVAMDMVGLTADDTLGLLTPSADPGAASKVLKSDANGKLALVGLDVDAGSASSPSLTLAGDTNTGIYQSAADKLDITTGGSQRINVSSNGLDVKGDYYIDGNRIAQAYYSGSVSNKYTSSTWTNLFNTSNVGDVTGVFLVYVTFDSHNQGGQVYKANIIAPIAMVYTTYESATYTVPFSLCTHARFGVTIDLLITTAPDPDNKTYLQIKVGENPTSAVTFYWYAVKLF